MLMKLKSLLLIAAAAAGMSAAAQSVVVTNVADFVTIGDKDGEAVELTLGSAQEVFFVWNKTDVEKWNAGQFKLAIPEGLTISATSFATPDNIMAEDEFGDPFDAWVYSCQVKDGVLTFILNAKAGNDVWVEDKAGSSKVPFAKFKLRPNAEDLSLTSAEGEDGVAFWVGGYQKYLGPKADIKVTAVRAIEADKQVAGVKYYNVAGVESDKAFDGVNIEVTTYVDGSTKAVKVVK